MCRKALSGLDVQKSHLNEITEKLWIADPEGLWRLQFSETATHVQEASGGSNSSQNMFQELFAAQTGPAGATDQFYSFVFHGM